MVINIRQLYEFVGEKAEINGEISRGRLDEIKGFSFTGPVTLKGIIQNRAGIVTLNYTAELTISAECDRCLSRFERDYSFEFEHILVRSLNSEDNDDYVVTDGDNLDMDELAVTDVLLQMPTKLLCKEDCKGMCPKCGADLNVSDCGCISGS